MDADSLITEGRPSEDQIVESWLLEQFTRLGFNAWQSVYLASVGADWHLAEELIERGCKPVHAVTILEPAF